MRKKIYIANTGGTIGMKKSAKGYRPEPGYLQKQMSLLPELDNDIMPEYVISEYDPLLDSSNMTPDHWLKIARDIEKNHDGYDGFIVIHGTDTMAYTASALPFLLEGLGKPVLLTGGQIPLCEVRNDSRENLITSMLIAANYDIPEICLFFGSRLLRGNRSVKADASGFDAFDSPNYPPLGTAGTEIRIKKDLILQRSSDKPGIRIRRIDKSQVAALRLFPGISESIMENILKPPIRGLVLETYGMGNGPADNEKFLDILRSASDRGIVLVNCTQCFKGKVVMDTYATGSALAAAGVINGADMTTEAALTKMFTLFSLDLSVDEIKKQMQMNLRGEITI